MMKRKYTPFRTLDGGNIPAAKSDWTRSAKAFQTYVSDNYTPLTVEDMAIHLSGAHNGNKNDIDIIINSVSPIAMRAGLCYSRNMNFMDYVQEALVVILGCIKTYDIDHNSAASFVTYCVSAIQKHFDSLGDYLDKTVPTKVPMYEIGVVNKFIDRYFVSRGEVASISDLSELDTKFDPVRAYESIISGSTVDTDYSNITADEYDGAQQDLTESFEHNDDVVGTLKFVIAACKKKIEISKNNAKNGVHDCNWLKHDNRLRDIEILFAYYGVDGAEPMDVEELSCKYNMTARRVEQIIKTTPDMIRELVTQHKHWKTNE